ncbi:MAG TPA: glycosyltransferase [Candidatus Saccharimonadales bacterium]|nr:glycosyltransferase [Candidatus Saccharimonadales bacterium]
MRVLLLGDARQPHFHRWGAALAAAGAEVAALTLQPPLPEAGPAGAAPAPAPAVALHALSAPGRGVARTRAALPEALAHARIWRPDLVSALFVPDYGLLGAWLCARLAPRPPLWVVALGSDVLRNAWRTPFHWARARWVLSRAALVAVDAAVLARGVARLGVPAERTARVDWLPDLRRFAFRAERPAGAPRIVSTRQLAPVYDVATLLRAAGLLARRHPGFELVVAGDGPERSRLERQAGRLGGRVRFAGRLDADGIAELLGSSGVYVSTARSDSTSVSLLEAMACGCLPVVTAIPGNQEWITEGSSGLLFAPGDARALAHQLERALDDELLREQVASFNRRRLEAVPAFEERVARLLASR